METKITVANRFTGETVDLTEEEHEAYQFIIAAEHYKKWPEFHSAMEWFREKNVRAYMVLLD